MKRCFILVGLFTVLACSVSAQNLVVENVKLVRHHSDKDRILVEKAGVLTFDDAAQALIFKNNGGGGELTVNYPDVDKVVFEPDTHMRGASFGTALLGVAAGPAGTAAAAVIAGRRVNDYWMYVAPAANKGKPFLVQVPKDFSVAAMNKAKALFAERVTIVEFEEKSEEIDKKTLKGYDTKEVFKADKEAHPLPELKPDKALVVVVCPGQAPDARFNMKLYANDQVIAVNKLGTYSFVYLDPGKYKLISQAENANGFEMELEAGKDYYFLQNIFQGTWTPRTGLSRNSKELVMFEVDGAYYSGWKQ